MENNGFSTSDAVLTAAMSGGGFYRGGGGLWGGGYGGDPYATLGSIQHGVGHVESCVRQGNENLQREFSFNHLADQINAQNNQRGQDMLQLTRELLDNRAKTDQCCCDIRLELAQKETRDVERYCKLESGQAEIKATLAANKEIAELRHQLTVEQTLNRQYCCPPPVKCVDPCCNGNGNGGPPGPP